VAVLTILAALFVFPMVARGEEPTEGVPRPVFSHEAGFFTENFNLTITAPEGYTIRFTTDGSVPTASSQLYTRPVAINSPVLNSRNSPMSTSAIGRSYEGGWHTNFVPNNYYNGMVVRARAFDSNGNYSETVTSSFFVQSGGRGSFSTRVISIAVEPQHFIHQTQGIYRNWDRTAWASQSDVCSEDGPRQVVNFEMFYPDGQLMFSQYASAWVFGNWSRRHPKRSLRFNFNQGSGDVMGMYYMIPETRRNFYDPLTTIGNFRHINARVTDRNRTGMRDSVVAFMAEPLRPTIQNSTYGALFVNGEFWGMYCLRAHRNEYLIGELYGIRRRYIEISDVARQQIYEPLIHGRNMALQENFDNFAAYVDVDNFIDYIILGIHFDNWDWVSNNFEFWRTTEIIPDVHGGDGRWRFIVQDFDEAINHASNDMMRFFTTSSDSRQNVPTLPWNFGSQQLRPSWATEIFRRLFANEEFRNTFAARYSTYMGTAFHPDMANAIIDKMVAERLPHVGADLFRWRYLGAGSPTNGIPRWEGNVDGMRDVLLRRSGYSLRHVRDYFNGAHNSNLNLRLDTSGFANITWRTDYTRGWFDISGAQIRPDLFERHGQHGFTTGNFSANYIRQLPITVTAHPLEGYRFSHFRVEGGNISNNNVSQNPMVVTPPSGSGNITVTAVFVGN